MTVELLPFRPKWDPRTQVLNTEHNYDYSPSAVLTPSGTYVWWTVGLGTDCIGCMNIHTGKVGEVFPSPPGKLVADPFALRLSSKWRVFVTVGDAQGKNNSIGFFDMTFGLKVMSGSFRMVGGLPQPEPGTYGIGQPSVLTTPNGHWLAYSYVRGFNYSQAQKLGPTLRTVAPEVSLGQSVASPDLSWHGGIYSLRTGAGQMQFFLWDLITEQWLPAGKPKIVPEGTIDGGATERMVDNSQRRTGGWPVAWVGSGDPSDQGTWKVRRVVMADPDGL